MAYRRRVRATENVLSSGGTVEGPHSRVRYLAFVSERPSDDIFNQPALFDRSKDKLKLLKRQISVLQKKKQAFVF